MDYMGFLEALVNAETEDERMALVKEHAETFMPQAGGGEELQGKLDEMSAAMEEANNTIKTLKQEIKDRFFGKYKEEIEEPEMESEESEEPKEATLKDLGFGQKQY